MSNIELSRSRKHIKDRLEETQENYIHSFTPKIPHKLIQTTIISSDISTVFLICSPEFQHIDIHAVVVVQK